MNKKVYQTVIATKSNIVRMSYCIWIFVLSASITNEVRAICTPKPDCASIGYTETSCKTNYLACPFDNTKLKCMPCDSIYRYDCSGDNIISGVGSVCNGKYASCSCIAGAIFKNGSCVCDTSCTHIGNIMYSDSSCSSCKIANKIAVGVVAHWNGAKTYILSLERKSLFWSKDVVDIPDLENVSTDVLNDLDGWSNCQKVLNYYGTDSSDYAVGYCFNYAPDIWQDTRGQWFLPAQGELYQIVHKNWSSINSAFSILGISGIGGDWHWSSTEKGTSAWVVNAWRGSMYTYGKNSFNYPVNCVLVL